jgi:predicted dehydrogenase
LNRAIRWGIWGTGAVAHDVARDFRLVPGAALHACASRTLERASRFASRHGIRKPYQGLDALLGDVEVDVVYIASPNHCHLDDCLACLHAGKAVLCEKPFALNLAQASQIAEEARRRNVFCMEGMWMRFIPAVAEAKRFVATGQLGAMLLMQGSFAYPIPSDAGPRFLDPNRGGGALLDRGVYLISLAQFLLGSPLQICGMTSPNPSGVDEQSAYSLVFPNGAVADLAASLRAHGSNEVLIAGDRGSVRLCAPFYRAHRLVLRSYSPPAGGSNLSAEPHGARKVVRKLREAPLTGSLLRRAGPLIDLLRRGDVRTYAFPGSGYQFEIEEVNRCLREQRTESTTMPLNDSLEVMRIVDALSAQMKAFTRDVSHAGHASS